MSFVSVPALLIATIALASSSVPSSDVTDEVVVFEKEDRGVVSRPAFLDSLVLSIKAEDAALLASVNWRSRDLGEIQDIVPTTICDRVDDLEDDQFEALSRYLLNNLIADRYWVCMALAEEVGCESNKTCGVTRVVPVAVAFENLDRLFPVPANPPCEHIVREPVAVDGDDPAYATVDWYRRLLVRRATCRNDGENVEYRYTHRDGWILLDKKPSEE